MDSTFTGKNGESFSINLIENLFKEDGYRRRKRVKVEFKDFLVESFIKSIHVPFLFSFGAQLPEFFEENLSGIQGFNNRSVNFGTFKREIDSVFEYYHKNDQEKCSVYCKNRKDELHLDKLILVIKKAMENNSKLSLVFCNSISEVRKSNSAVLKKNCKSFNWNILKTESWSSSEGKKIFSFVPLFKELILHPEPSLTCIVFE